MTKSRRFEESGGDFCAEFLESEAETVSYNDGENIISVTSSFTWIFTFARL